MRMIDQIAYRSGLRYVNPCIKTFLAVATLLICVSAHSVFISLITLFVMGILAVYKGKVPLAYFIKLYRIPVLFLVLSTFSIVISLSEKPLPGIVIPFFHQYLIFKENAIYTAVNLIITALGAVSCLYFLSLTTPVIDLLYVLDFIHCPAVLSELLLLIYRFIFVLYEIAAAITTSQKSRLGNKNIKTSIFSMSGMLFILLINGIRKSSVLYDAMEARCYDGKILVLREVTKATKQEIVMAAAFVTFMIGISLLQRSLF
ncbi:cobalt ECF transporter T component CbiQ [Anaerocolumna sedimenticola]|uniref:Cobalt ECF transporter T component CbiQ n=1 Tax=Anaerocolumna sedimenticola TaxID=2696063 RepID=A0A6P1TNL1_9FIRM|nr:cobalt ECF transporter T component CbiQ [Anaerocolumna sedimenticola]QHQ61245.1 cobalt ECF transporter T component CbiQ [Anaerocolumna sedimenticola]